MPVEGEFTAVTNASNQVQPGGVFVAIKGFTSDGAKYAPDAISRGARLVVAQEPIDGVPTAVVPDARVALAQLACAFAGDPSHELTVYGVTGTNGKTTSSYVLHGILSAAYGEDATGLLTTAEIVVGRHREPAVRTTGEAPVVQGNLRRMLDGGAKHVVLETSSHGLALHRVLGTRYAAALFTNLTRDHLDFHPDMEDYYRTKRRLFERTDGPKLVNADDEYGRRIADEVMSGADSSNTAVVLERREAIRQALDEARPGDVVVVAGKGHERVQHLPTGDIDFHDPTVVTELLADR